MHDHLADLSLALSRCSLSPVAPVEVASTFLVNIGDPYTPNQTCLQYTLENPLKAGSSPCSVVQEFRRHTFTTLTPALFWCRSVRYYRRPSRAARLHVPARIVASVRGRRLLPKNTPLHQQRTLFFLFLTQRTPKHTTRAEHPGGILGGSGCGGFQRTARRMDDTPYEWSCHASPFLQVHRVRYARRIHGTVSSK